MILKYNPHTHTHTHTNYTQSQCKHSSAFFNFFYLSNIILPLPDDCHNKDGMKPIVTEKHLCY